MAKVTQSVVDGLDVFMAWLSTSLGQSVESYCAIETADSAYNLVAHDGSLVSIIRLKGVNQLVGQDEFDRITTAIIQSLQTSMNRSGSKIQVLFNYDKQGTRHEIEGVLAPSLETSKRLNLDLDDLFDERVNNLSKYCSKEDVFLVCWTSPQSLAPEQMKRSLKDKAEYTNENNIPPFYDTQFIAAAVPELRERHDSYVKSLQDSFSMVGLITEVLEVHDAVLEMRKTVDPEFTSRDWRPHLPGDSIPVNTMKDYGKATPSDLLWPSLGRQLMPRDAENKSLRSVRIGDRIYSTLFISMFPKDIQRFMHLFARATQGKIPWRISFFIESDGLSSMSLKSSLAAILTVTSKQNRLFSDAVNLLNYIRLNTDDVVVRLRVSLATWAPFDDEALLRDRASQLAQAVEGWGSCDVTEVCGDAFGGVVSSMLGVSDNSLAPATAAPLSDTVYMLPLFRPASSWHSGAVLFRSPDGKLWPYQPGSPQQTTWIELVYARPGSGKSVLSNSMNLALCLSPGIVRLPHIAIIDIGPSSSGLISLLKEALPPNQRHLVAYHRLRMTDDYAINPFDSQLGCRYPSAQERSFLTNFLVLLSTPVGEASPYDGIADMVGMIVDEMYKSLADDGAPHPYTKNVEEVIDAILEEIGFKADKHSTWWEVTDTLYLAGFHHEAMLAQRHAMPVLADAASIARSSTVEDLYGKVVAPTGEPLITAFSRMISSAVREYPIIGKVTQFDLGESRVVSLDLDEVAKSGGDAANRQTAVMYMVARYVLAKNFYVTEDSVKDMPEAYQSYHQERVKEIREDHKRIVFDEFHRTSHTQAVRDQVIIDMREGRKWGVQISLLSQSLDDFDEVMIEFATGVFIMDAGPEQAIRKTTEVFGLSQTAQYALRNRVHGPRESGATFLAQFATKSGVNTQLLTSTLGPIELWAFSTTVADVRIRSALYQALGPEKARKLLAKAFPAGTASKMLESRLAQKEQETSDFIASEEAESVIDEIVKELLAKASA